jgi:hypothetical protein
MRLNNQSKVGLTTVICLLVQGYAFTYIMKLEPLFIMPIAPLIPYLLYIYARNKRSWYYDRPLYWIFTIICLTIADLALYALIL